MIQAQSADGVIHQFPDGTDSAVIDRTMKTYAQKPSQAGGLSDLVARGIGVKTQARPWTQNVTGFMANVNRGLGVGDELAAAGNTAVNVLSGKTPILGAAEDFQNSLAKQRAYEGDFSQAHPHVAALARGTGMAATAAVPAGDAANAFAQAPRAMNALRGATTAGLTAAGYAAADAGTPAERLKAASSAATNPIVLGLGAAGGAIAPAAKIAKAPQPKVTVQGLKAAKNAAYQAVDNMGVAYTPEASQSLSQGITDELKAANISATRHPKAYSMMQDVQERLGAGQPVTMSQLDQLRQEVSRDLTSARNDPAERFMGQKIKRNIDEFVDSAGPDQMIAGSAPDAAQAIATARDLNSRYRKVEAVQNARTSAELRAGSTGSGGNVNNATRQNLRKLIDPSSSRQIRNLTPDETNALQSTVMGTPGQNALRQIGKLSPEGNGLMLAGHVAAAVPSGGTSGLIAIAGALSKHIADRQTSRQVEGLIQLMGQGAPGETTNAERQLAMMASQDPQVAAVYREVRARLARAVGVGGGAATSSPAQ